MMSNKLFTVLRKEKGSLALEQVLFIGAIVAFSAGLFAFYNNLSAYFSSVNLSNVPSTVNSPTGNSTGP